MPASAHLLAGLDGLDDSYLAELQPLLLDVPPGVPLVDKGIEFMSEDE